jgi:hypothetical protein
MNLLSGAEEVRIGSRNYRKSNLTELTAWHQKVSAFVLSAGLANGTYTTRAYAAWPLRKGGIPPWGSINTSNEL